MNKKTGYTNNYYQNQKQVIKAAGSGRVDRAITNPKKQFEPSSDTKKTKQEIIKTQPNIDYKEIAAKKIFRLLLTNYRRNQYKKLLKWHRYRKFVVEELIKTEENYIKDLQLIIIIKNTVAQWLNKIQLDTIFMNVQQLHKLNDSFLKEIIAIPIEKRTRILGKTLHDNAPFFKIYFIYYEGFNKSIIMLKQCRNDKPEVKKYLNQIQHLNEFNCQDIESLLIKPVQRLPKYILLLEDLLKHTEQNHPDLENLKRSLELFRKVADDNNANMNKLLSSKLFELQKWFGSYIEVIDSKRQYLTEILAQILYQRKEKNVTTFFLSDLIIIGERQDDNPSKPYSYVQSVFLDESSECLDLSDQQYIKNSFILQGMNGQSITFIEQSKEEKINKIDKINKLIAECKEKSKFKFQRNANRFKSSQIDDLAQSQNFPIKVSALGVDERQENLSTYKVYIIEVGIADIFQKIFLRYSQCQKIQDDIKKKYPKIQLNFINTDGLGLFGDQKKEIEVRLIQIPLFIQSFLHSDIPKLNSDYLVELGLPKNFYGLPNLITDEIREQAQIKKKGIDRLSYISPQRTMTKGLSNNEQSSLQPSSQIRRFSASQLLKKESQTFQQKGKKNEKEDTISLLIHHCSPNEKPLNIQIEKNTKVLYVLEQIQNEFQLQEIYDFKLLIYDNKQRLKILENDEHVVDLFSNSFLFDALKKKELYFRKIIFLDIEAEKIQLYQDNNRVKLLYYQFVKDISTASIKLTTIDEYSKIAALYYYLQNKPLTYEIIQQIIPNGILKQQAKECWICFINEEYKAIKDSIDNTQSTMIEQNEYVNSKKTQNKGGFFSSLISSKNNDKEKQWENTNIDLNKGMMQMIIKCLNNEFSVQQLFKVSCNEAQSQFGEKNLILGVGYQGIKLYNSTKDRVWKKIETIESFNVYPGSIEITYGMKKYIFETTQGFQIQSLFDEYQAIKQQTL